MAKKWKNLGTVLLVLFLLFLPIPKVNADSLDDKPFNVIAQQLFESRALVEVIAEYNPIGGRKEITSATGIIVAKQILIENQKETFRYLIISVAHLVESLAVFMDKEKIPDFKAFFSENDKFSAPLSAELLKVYWKKDRLLLAINDTDKDRFKAVRPLEISAKNPKSFDRVYSIGYFLGVFFDLAEGYVLPPLELPFKKNKDGDDKNNGIDLGDLRIWLYKGELGSGMSGGAILDSEGKLMGLNQAIISAASETRSGHVVIGTRIRPSFNYLELNDDEEIKKGGEK